MNWNTSTGCQRPWTTRVKQRARRYFAKTIPYLNLVMNSVRLLITKEGKRVSSNREGFYSFIAVRDK